MPARNRTALHAGKYDSASQPVARRGYVPLSAMARIEKFGDDEVECIANPYGWFVLLRVKSGPNKGAQLNADMSDPSHLAQFTMRKSPAKD